MWSYAAGADPTKRNPPGAGLSEKSKAEFPPEKMAEFEGGPPGSVPLLRLPHLAPLLHSPGFLLALYDGLWWLLAKVLL